MLFFAFLEFISSTSFAQLLKGCWNLIDPSMGLGIYQQGLPVRPVVDFIWGTDTGLRTYPLILFLTCLQLLFSFIWPIVYLVLTITFPFFGFFFATKLYKKTDIFTILAGIFYAGNIWVVQRIFSGFWQLDISYAFLPFLITIPLFLLKQKKTPLRALIFWSFLVAIFLTAIFLAQPHFIFMLIPFYFLLICALLLKTQWKHIVKLFLLFVLSLVSIFFLNAYNIIPSIFFPELLFTAPNQYFSLAAVAFNGHGASLINVLRMNATPFPFIERPWNIIDYLQLLPVFVIFIISLVNRKKIVLYFLPFCFFIFLAKGLHAPGAHISNFLYDHIFVLHYFRDPTRFVAAIGIYGSFIISSLTQKNFLSVQKRVWITIAAIIYMLILSGNMLKFEAFIPFQLPHAYLSLQTYFQKNIKQSIPLRYVSFPNNTSMKYTWYENPYPIYSPSVFYMVSPLSIPSADSNYYPDSYSSQISAYLYSRFATTHNESALLPLAVNYFITDTSTHNQLGASIQSNFLTKGYKPLFDEKPLMVFQSHSAPHLISREKPLFALGNLHTLEKLHTYTSRPIILLNQSPNSARANSSDLRGEDFYNDVPNPLITLVGEQLMNSYALPLLKVGWNYDTVFTNYEPYKMIDIISDGDLFTSGYAVVAQNIPGNITIPQTFSSGTYHVLLKIKNIHTSPILLHTSIGSTEIVLPETKTLSWIDGKTIVLKKSVSSLTIKRESTSQLIVDAFVLVPENIYNHFTQDAQNTLGSLHKLDTDDIIGDEKNEKTDGIHYSVDSITFRNPTKYFTYRFSYGKYWKSNSPSILFMSDGYGMTFVSKTPSLKTIYYSPNYYFHIALIISMCSAIVIVGYMCWFLVKRKMRNS